MEPLASNILNLYKKYESTSFDIYHSGEALSKERILEVLKIKTDASVESVAFFYDNKQAFQLLIFSSYGTKYANFIDRIVAFEDENHKKVLNMIHEKGYQSVITDEGLHLINHAYIYALAELVVHADSKEQAMTNAKAIAQFFSDGWKRIRGL